MQLLSCLVYSVSVGAVHHKDESLRACVVVPPQRSDLVLSTHVLGGGRGGGGRGGGEGRGGVISGNTGSKYEPSLGFQIFQILAENHGLYIIRRFDFLSTP